jgi:hypothetical protein
MGPEVQASRGSARKMHPLFIEVYLAEEPEEERKVMRRARKRMVVIQRRLARGA